MTKRKVEIKDIAPIKLRGKVFTENDLSIIVSCVQENYKLGRTNISRTVCEKLDWRQPNGWLKDRACRDVLLRLETLGLIRLPPTLVTRNPAHQNPIKDFGILLKDYDLKTPIHEFPDQIEFVFAKGNSEERIWNTVVNNYHYLGHQVIVGKCIKYLIKSDSKLLGAISFSSPSWQLHSRDVILASLGIENSREYTINNSRFLILPHVIVKNLASYILSTATKRVVKDWKSFYSVTPLIAETFVQPSRFDGTCYKAANWIDVGVTKGYAKRGTSYRNSQEPKKIFLYGLSKKIRCSLQQIYMEKS